MAAAATTAVARFGALFALAILVGCVFCVQADEELVVVRPFTAHFFYERFGAHLSARDRIRYFDIFTNANLAKSQAAKKIDAIMATREATLKVCDGGGRIAD